MICKGGKRSNAGSLATHLLKTENERVVIVELKHTATQDLHDALRDMELAVKMTKAKTGLYHAQINPATGEEMTPTQWKFAVDEMERRLGLDNQPRAVVYHIKNDRPHMHVVWQRTDIEKGKVIDNKNDYYIHKKLGRDLEKAFGHQRLNNEFNNNWEKMHERQQTIQDGYTPKQLKARIADIYKRNEDPKKLQSELKKAGFELAQGRKGVTLVSEHNKVYSLTRYAGQKKKDVDKKLQPILKNLPKVENIQKGKVRTQEKNVATELEKKLSQQKHTFVENTFNILDKDEIGKTAAKFDKIKAEFKLKQYERLTQDFKDNNPDLTDVFDEMDWEIKLAKEREEERGLTQEKENENNRGYNK